MKSRLKKRLEEADNFLVNTPEYDETDQELVLGEQFMLPDDYDDTDAYYPAEDSSLISEYDRLQAKAIEYEKQQANLHADNPHTLYNEVISNPSEPGKFALDIGNGRTIDLAQLETYLTKTTNPKVVTVQMRYEDSETLQKIKGTGKLHKTSFKLGPIWILIGFIGVFILAAFLIFGGAATIGELIGGFFGR